MSEVKTPPPVRFFAQPIGAKQYHIFEGGRSLCGGWLLLNPDKDQCTNVTGNETYSKGQDCKQCFKKAGLKIPKKEK